MSTRSSVITSGREAASVTERERLPVSAEAHTKRLGPWPVKKPQANIELLSDGSFFVSGDPAMIALRQQIEKIAGYDIPVLILGESGTGKEVVARLIHSRSSRAKRRFLKVNCAALPASLLESELFGYERGAFTGAIRSNPGQI